ncbi:hypothetical protein GGH92_010886 [Coemansia sp. RSA 2673]|nr:hypothetical protein GGH92_010886 [Coemansia sp. RSA 2673]
MVRFYHGEYTPGATPDAAPILPPPTPEDVSALKAVVARALTELEKTELNGAKLRVRESFNDDPNQLHEWYDDMAIAKKSAITLQRRNPGT